MKTDIYTKIYLNTIITEQNIKSLTNLVQNQLFKQLGINTYQEVKDKNSFQNNLNNELNRIKQKVQSITNNLQYQSWLYKILKQQDKNIDEDYEVIKDIINDFTKLSRNPTLNPNQKNIQNYNSFQDLTKFVLSFDNRLTGDKNIYKDLQLLYQNNSFTCYLITDYQSCHHLFGKESNIASDCIFNIGWCVAKNQYYFNKYINKYYDKFDGYIVFIQNKTNKPYALLHYGSYQFKDIHDQPLKDNNPDIIEALYYFNNNTEDYNGDLEFYKYYIYKFNNPNRSRLQFQLELIEAKIDQKNKIIDFGSNKPIITNNLLNELCPDGIFNYTIKSINHDWSTLFNICYSLKQINSNFIIPNYVTDCSKMFRYCNMLQKLPQNFTIPNSIKNCTSMFSYCKSLQYLPQLFTIPNSVKNCTNMFFYCELLQKLPQNFTIPNSVKYCLYMFYECKSLKYLPKNFTIPKTSNSKDIFKKCINLKGINQ